MLHLLKFSQIQSTDRKDGDLLFLTLALYVLREQSRLLDAASLSEPHGEVEGCVLTQTHEVGAIFNSSKGHH